MSILNFMLNSVEHEKSCIPSGPDLIGYCGWPKYATLLRRWPVNRKLVNVYGYTSMFFHHFTKRSNLSILTQAQVLEWL